MRRATGANGRVYEAERTPTTSPRGDRYHVTVVDPTVPDDERNGRAYVLRADTDDGLIWTVDEAQRAIDDYEAKAAARAWPDIEE